MKTNKIYKDIQEMRVHFGWDKTDTIPFMTKALLDEAQELYESLDISEAEYKKELADVLMYAFAICIDQGYDVETLIRHKISEVMEREY